MSKNKLQKEKNIMLQISIVLGIFSIILEIVSRVDKLFKKESKAMSNLCKALFVVFGIIAL